MPEPPQAHKGYKEQKKKTAGNRNMAALAA
jgi:hypothetical protein